jgi:hypothetical protein
VNFLRAVPTVFCAALIGAAFSPNVQADDWNQKTVVTFSAPVETPGVHIKGWEVLPAGTYVFKLLGSPSDRHIVQIFNKDETVLYTTVLAIPNYRLRATGKTVITFRERPVGEPEALRAWFYPGMNFGQEFVYPKEKALELAKETNIPVLYTPAVIVAVEPVAAVEELKQVPVQAVSPAGVDVEVAQVVTPPPPAEALAAAPVAQTLPKTASSLPLIGLFGLLALGAACTLKFARARA